MMTVEIRVNGELIRYVEIINRGAPEMAMADDDRVYEYRSDARTGVNMTGQVVHRRSKGAYALAAHVLVRLRDAENAPKAGG